MCVYFYLHSYIISMAFFYVKPSIFVIDSTFRIFSCELHDVPVPWLGTDRPHEEVYFTFSVSEHVFPTTDIFQTQKNMRKVYFLVYHIYTYNKILLCFFQNLTSFISYHASISDVDVMWRPGIVIGLSNLTGGLVSTITGSEVWTAVLLAKSIAEIIRIWYYYNLCRYAVLYYWMRIVSALSMIKISGFKCAKSRRT